MPLFPTPFRLPALPLSPPRAWTAFVLAALALVVSGVGAFGAVPSAAAQNATAPGDAVPLLRHPAVHPSGESVAFAYQGDLWTVSARGGRALRLTVHDAYDAHPVWSPDGAHLAFTSDRFGNDDVYWMDAGGGAPTRLTHHSAPDRATGVTGDGRVLFTTERLFVGAQWQPEVHAVRPPGGTPVRMLDALGTTPVPSPDGRFVAFVRGVNRLQRPDYRGPANKDLWLYDTESDTYRRLTTFDGNDHTPVWAGPRTLYFISKRTGASNLYRLSLHDDGRVDGAPEALTDVTADGVRHASASADGSVAVVERQSGLFVLDAEADTGLRRLDVQVPADSRRLPVSRITASDDADAYAVSPDGSQVAFVVRGDVFVTEAEADDARTVRVTRHPYRDRDVAWLDDRTLVFASDRAGDQYDLYRIAPDDDGADRLFDGLTFSATRLTDTPADERRPVVAPGGSQVAFQRGRGSLLVAPLDGGALGDAVTLLDGWAEPDGVTWSPDGRWIAYSRDDLDFNEEVYVLAADGSAGPVNVSQHPRGDENPVWSPDGSKLAFASERGGTDTNVWFAWLREADWERTQREWKEQPDSSAAVAADGAPMTMDLDGIHDRLVRVTSMPGNEETPVFSRDGQTLYFVANASDWTESDESKSDLYRIAWDGSTRTRIAEGVDAEDLALGPDGSHVYYRGHKAQLYRVVHADASVEAVPFAASFSVDHADERRQIFAEIGRTIDRGFYDPDLHGVNWDSLHAVYRPWALRASTERDFADVVNRMLGEVNASHMGYRPGDDAAGDAGAGAATGRLGAVLVPADGGVEVTRVVPGSPADREASPLRPGDVITAINGAPIAPDESVYAHLDGTAGERTLLDVRGPDGDPRRVEIRPTDDLEEELYREWVEERRALVDEYSDGRLGYVHIEAMNWQSFERFERELAANAGDKEGLIVDVRFNGGGWTTDYLMTVLDVRQHAYTVPRGAVDDLSQHPRLRAHYPFGERLPYAAWTRPVAALANENSYSNAEIFAHAFKTLDLGPLVGQPTFGAVISTGSVDLIDGSSVRLPSRGWYVAGSGANMETTPAAPDVVVDAPVDARARGVDPQLQRTVDVLLRQIDADAAPTSGRPSAPGSSSGGASDGASDGASGRASSNR